MSEPLPLSLLNDYLYCPRRAAGSFAQFGLQVAGAVEDAQQPEAIGQHLVKDQISVEAAHAPGARFRRTEVRPDAADSRPLRQGGPRWI